MKARISRHWGTMMYTLKFYLHRHLMEDLGKFWLPENVNWNIISINVMWI